MVAEGRRQLPPRGRLPRFMERRLCWPRRSPWRHQVPPSSHVVDQELGRGDTARSARRLLRNVPRIVTACTI
jgi:hypothetical protein